MAVKIVKERNKPLVTLDIDSPYLITNDIKDIVAIIQSNLLLGSNIFPFNPTRGVDKDKYLFEYKDKMTLQEEMFYMRKQIEGLDERISNVDISAEAREGNVTHLNATVLVNGENFKITIQV